MEGVRNLRKVPSPDDGRDMLDDYPSNTSGRPSGAWLRALDEQKSCNSKMQNRCREMTTKLQGIREAANRMLRSDSAATRDNVGKVGRFEWSLPLSPRLVLGQEKSGTNYN
jgi:hypothetical protein